MLANYHTHTKWCKHGEGEIEDYIQVAFDYGLKELAITEHVPHKDNLDKRRLQWEEFPAFDEALNKAIDKYKYKIHMIKGFECEYYPEVMDTYRMLKEDYGYQLFILGQHRSGANREIDNFAKKGMQEMELYADEICRGIETGLFAFLAHPDLAIQGYSPGWDTNCEKIMRRIYKVCEAFDIPVEINANGLRDHRSYPSIDAFRLSTEYQLKYLINSDAHTPQCLCGENIVMAEAFAQNLKLPITELLHLPK